MNVQLILSAQCEQFPQLSRLQRTVVLIVVVLIIMTRIDAGPLQSLLA